MDAERYLMQIRKMDMIIDNKMMELERLEALAVISSSGTGERVQTSVDGDRMVTAVQRIIEKREEINRDIDRLVEVKSEAVMLLEQLAAGEYDILYTLYVDGMGILEYTKKKGYGRTSAWRLKKRAIKNLQKILDLRKVETQ